MAKLALAVTAATADAPDLAVALYRSTVVLNAVFPPLAIGAIVTGVLLSLGTKWGVLQHYWVTTKLVLSVAVIATAIRFSDRLVGQAIAATAESAMPNSLLPALADPTALLIALAATHLLMLAIATVVSFYKPWGKTWLGRRPAAQPLRPASYEGPTSR
ncbi:MAG: hypothetical protein IT340_04225 [Chloroflexi bacterium]|nr:hypothetical protein [Chloroflexota bacterium]